MSLAEAIDEWQQRKGRDACAFDQTEIPHLPCLRMLFLVGYVEPLATFGDNVGWLATQAGRDAGLQ